MNNIAIKIEYDAFFADDTLEDFRGIEEFKKDLSNDYIAYVKGQGVGRGGAAYDLTVEVIMNIDLKTFIEIIVSGVAYDLVKDGTKKLFLKPLIAALEKLNNINNNQVRVGLFKLKFEESDIIISSINQHGALYIIPKIISSLIEHYNNLRFPNSNLVPDEIRIPIIYDARLEKYDGVKYRELSEMEDFEKNLDNDHYFKFWGLCYNIRQQFLVYSLADRKITDDEFYLSYIYEGYVAPKIADKESTDN